MDSKKTPWAAAAQAGGATESERYLAGLARKAFLSLWSFTNLFTGEGRRNGKGDGKELCDLLVVFGTNVLLFSDKHCEFPKHPDLQVSWARWYKSAVEKSARQLAGAEKFIREHPCRIFLDKHCQARLPIALPAPNDATYFLIAVTRGSYGRAAKYWGGGSSGSLLLDTGIEGRAHHEAPFRIGFPLGGRRFVHVLDEMTVDVLLSELDTVPDLVAYLKCKEAFLTRPGLHLSVAGEEQLLARYMCTMRDGKHALPEIPADVDFVALVEGDWEMYSSSPQRVAKKKADEQSYLWDDLIEHQSRFIRTDAALSILGAANSHDDHERVVRALADETRLSRRHLAAHFLHALSTSVPGKKFARVVFSPDARHRAYVFLTAPRPADVSYDEYREMRSVALLAYCHGVKLKAPFVKEVVGVASEPFSERESSQDFVHVDLSDEMEPEETKHWQEVMGELGVLQSPTLKPMTGRDHEFPLPFTFEEGPEFLSTEDWKPSGRK